MMSDGKRVDDVLIVGAGLAGLVAARRLEEVAPGCRWRIVEARARAGGRILTVPTTAGVEVDLGPTWIWPHQVEIWDLLAQVGIGTFEQYERGMGVFDQGSEERAQRFVGPPREERSYRIMGGMQALVQALVRQLPPERIVYGEIVRRITAAAGELGAVTQRRRRWPARQVIVTLPPRLAGRLTYEPALPLPVLAAMQETQTWMGQAMKVALAYERPFWREAGLSGVAVSYIGPVQQYHDASPAGGKPGALFGWVGNQSAGREMGRAARRQAVIAQATRLFGREAAAPLDYVECNWAEERFTHAGKMVAEVEHPHYGAPALQDAQLAGRLHWASTEVSPVGGGYLEGAVHVGRRVAERVAAQLAGA